MSHETPRRDILVLAAGLLAGGIATRGIAAPVLAPPTGTIELFPSEITATIAGPAEGGLDFWAGRVLTALGRTLPPGTRLRPVTVGAADGVTGANQFEVRTDPDGASLMLAPGAAALAWLVGDPRAKFDIGHWMPLMTGVSSSVMVFRDGVLPGAAGQELRVATRSVAGSDLAGLLAVELLGARPIPVLLQPGESGMQAVETGRADALLLRGRAALKTIDGGPQPVFMLPAFTLGDRNERGVRVRDSALSHLPHFAEYFSRARGHLPSGPLYQAWQAVAAAAQLEFAAVLPQLTPAAMVALWRRAGDEATQSNELRAAAGTMAVRVTGGIASTSAMAEAIADTASLLELRRWLGTRLGYHPS